MVQLTRIQAISLVRRSHLAKMVIAFCVVFLMGGLTLFHNTKTVEVRVDGETVRIKTFYKTVGQALTYSKFNLYPEDIVTPSRDTLVTPGLQVEIAKSVPVQLAVDEQVLKTRTPAKTVGEALTDLSERFGLQIKDVDEVSVARSEALTSDMDISVRRAIPVSVRADGKETNTYIAPRTVADALTKLEIDLGAKDKVSLPLDHMLTPNDKIQIVRVVERIENVKSEIPFQNIVQAGDYPVGLPDKIISRGSNGLQEQTVKMTLEDGAEVDREVLFQRLVTPPNNQVISRGAQTSISRGGSTINFKRAYVMTATAYCIPGGTTATGTTVAWGTVAVDPSVIPLGSSLYVEGYGQARALDTGGAIKGNRIDLYMNSTEAALSFGVRSVVVYLQ